MITGVYGRRSIQLSRRGPGRARIVRKPEEEGGCAAETALNNRESLRDAATLHKRRQASQALQIRHKRANPRLGARSEARQSASAGQGSGATSCTRSVICQQFTIHGLSTTRGTRTKPTSIMAVKRLDQLGSLVRVLEPIRSDRPPLLGGETIVRIRNDSPCFVGKQSGGGNGDRLQSEAEVHASFPTH